MRGQEQPSLFFEMDENEIPKEFLKLLDNLKESEWDTKVDDNWTIKDIIAHLVGWENECVKELEKTWETKKKPWFLTTNSFDGFNEKSVDKYKNYPPKKLLREWKHWQNLLDKKIKDMGKDNLKKEGELFGWVFDEGEGSHYHEHFNQIKESLKSS